MLGSTALAPAGLVWLRLYGDWHGEGIAQVPFDAVPVIKTPDVTELDPRLEPQQFELSFDDE